ncbi:MAG: AAA family ATPase [Candidatus Helarchaeota archaeon]
MISRIEINNFKSINHLILEPKKVNVFIGEPNTGKSNILEGLGLFSALSYGKFKDSIRIQNMSNIFYDNDISTPVEIFMDELSLKILYHENIFRFEYHVGNVREFTILYDYFGNSKMRPSRSFISKNQFKFYKYIPIDHYENEFMDFLLPPNGLNLLNLLLTHEKFKKFANEFFLKNGLRIMFKPQEKKIEIVKYQNDILISYPYSLISDTLRRYIFYFMAILSNKTSVLIFEEPETHSFPQFIKYIAEKVALDNNNNQYFISTHNPYFLLSLIEKTPKKDLRIYLTYYKNFNTKIKVLSQKDIQKIIDFEIDPFFNAHKYIEAD